MLNRLEVSALPSGRRWAAQLQFRIDGEEVVAEAVGEGGRGPLAEEALPAHGHGPFWATGEGRRVVLGEPECTGGCCGYLSVFVQRHGGIVEWSDWQVPIDRVRPPAFYFDADQYDAELTRALTDRRWQVYRSD
ncbi:MULTISPECIES: hypothetical protein [unclassified Streptomyces]|uniref:hypothetical protein n=1 Tax=unclassified Streptomyces TaxID=2593676 RepID=UPI002E82364D|nr:hypothetical protein [Streptomyces sp. NBC_00589]WTI41917.1 hypothetical protein OIC96_46550 [Streptomyces sp. NBC_00775]WUB24400.1 hypothetical protein OHA51_03170 [Streptomyces sp. NBC_00589]